MRWGFSHEAGPFELWDMLGVADTVQKMDEAGFDVAPWVREMLDGGFEQFYQNGSYYDFDSCRYVPAVGDRNVIVINKLRDEGREVARKDGASLLDMGDGVLLLEFHSKMNAIDQDIIDMSTAARSGCRLISMRWSSATRAKTSASARIWRWSASPPRRACGTSLTRRSGRYRRLPPAAPRAKACRHRRARHGHGGAEMAMAGWETVAAHESYIGLVEVGVGVIPAGGGCKESLRRNVNPVMRTENADVLPPLQATFERIAMAKVGESAWQAKAMGYLAPGDTIVMNPQHRLAIAKKRARHLADVGARPPEVEPVYAAGKTSLAALQLGLQIPLGPLRHRARRTYRPQAGLRRRRDLSAPVDPGTFST